MSMSGVKRKSSFATPDDRPSKLAKRSTTDKSTPSKPTSLPKFPSTKTKEIALSGSSASESSDLESPTPPLLRRASTLTVEEKEAKAAESLTKRSSSKRVSSSPKVSLTKKVSSVVVESGTVTTVVPLKSGSSIGETSLVSKESLKKAASLTKSLSKAASVRSTSSAGGAETSDKAEPMAVTPALPPGGLLEVAISFDTTGSMYGVLEEVRAKVKDLAQRLQSDIPGIRIAIIAHGDYCDADTYIIQWIDFGASLPELCQFVENVERTGGGDGPECYELVLKRAREELAWTPGSQRVLVVIGDDEPHPVGYKYGGQTYYIDWKEECDLLKEMGVKVYGVQANVFGGAASGFYKEVADRTNGQSANLKNFSSIFDFLMMICYREGNPDMMPVYASEVRARHVGGMAKDMEELVKNFGGASRSKTSFTAPGSSGLFGAPAPGSTGLFGTPAPGPSGLFGAPAPGSSGLFGAPGLFGTPGLLGTPGLFGTVAKTKAAKTAKKHTAIKKHAKPVKGAKPVKKTKKVTKKPKISADKKKVKKATPKTVVKKIKGKAKKKVPKRKIVIPKKLFREKLSDAKLIAGSLKKLEWSDWYLAVCESIPIGYSYKKFQKSPIFSSYHRRNLFENDTKTPAVYEVGIKFPGYLKKKMHVMYYRVSRGFDSKKRLTLYVLHNKKIRIEVQRLLDNRCEIFIRRGVVKGKNKKKNEDDIKMAANYLKSFDYGWGRHGKKGHRKIVRKTVMLSDSSL